jgi:hypothetical protein
MTPAAATFATALKAAIAHQRIPLERLQEHLSQAGHSVSIATLSYWQNGRSMPHRASSFAAVTELERVLDLAPDSLLALVDNARQAREDAKIANLSRALPVSELVVSLARSLGLRFDAGTRGVTQHCLLEIGPERVEHSATVRQTLVAFRNGIHSFPVVQHQFVDDRTAPEITARLGCSVGRTMPLPERQLQLAEIVLDRPLARGEAALAEYGVVYGPSAVPTTRHERSVPRPLRELVLQVRFHPDCLPTKVTYGVRDNYDDPPEVGVHREIALAGHTAQHIVFDAAPGVHGLFWQWD